MISALLRADRALFYQINNLAGNNAMLDAGMVFISQYGPLFFGLIFLWLWFGGAVKEARSVNRKTVIYAVCSAMIGLGINNIIGHIYFRPRPFTVHAVRLLLDHSPDASFPSDHSTGGFAIAFMLLSANRTVGLLSLVFAALLAFSRVYTGVHYPLDVLCGALTGLISSIIVTLFKNKLERKRV